MIETDAQRTQRFYIIDQLRAAIKACEAMGNSVQEPEWDADDFQDITHYKGAYSSAVIHTTTAIESLIRADMKRVYTPCSECGCTKETYIKRGEQE